MLNVRIRLLRIFSFHDIINSDNYSIHFDIEDRLHFSVELAIEEIHNRFVIDWIWCFVHYEVQEYVHIHCNKIMIHHVDVWKIRLVDHNLHEVFHIVLWYEFDQIETIEKRYRIVRKKCMTYSLIFFWCCGCASR